MKRRLAPTVGHVLRREELEDLRVVGLAAHEICKLQAAAAAARSKKQVALCSVCAYCMDNQVMTSELHQATRAAPEDVLQMYPKMYKMRTPSLFIHHQITNLRVLTELLSAHIEGLSMPNAVSREALLCRESMLTISVLLPKLEATRQALQPLDEEEGLQQRLRVCENCD